MLPYVGMTNREAGRLSSASVCFQGAVESRYVQGIYCLFTSLLTSKTPERVQSHMIYIHVTWVNAQVFPWCDDINQHLSFSPCSWMQLNRRFKCWFWSRYGHNLSGWTHLELWGCEMMVPAPVEATSPADINLVLRETCFISCFINKHSPTHSPNV